jgi:hypothetical protein
MKIRITRVAAARSQLREAIRLWFIDGDIPSMHSLACGAHQVIADINTSRGGRDLLYDTLVIKDEYRREWVNTLKEPYNFLKHADKDPNPEKDIDLYSDNTEVVILFTCLGLELLGYPFELSERAFVIYFGLMHPEIWREGGDLFASFTADYISTVRGLPKIAFYQRLDEFCKSEEKCG